MDSGLQVASLNLYLSVVQWERVVFTHTQRKRERARGRERGCPALIGQEKRPISFQPGLRPRGSRPKTPIPASA